MKKLLFLSAFILAFSVLTQARGEAAFPSQCYTNEMSCDPCEEAGCMPCDPCSQFKNRYCGRKKSFWEQLEFEGWIQAGVYVNKRGNKTERIYENNNRGREVTYKESGSGNSDLLSTVHSSDFQVNQIWLNLSKAADGKHGLDWGFRAEVSFGTDCFLSQSSNDSTFDYGWQDGDYYTAIPQLYFELAYGDLTAKFGKYGTTIGYESFNAPGSFFYSHSHMFMSEPSTHTGVCFEYTPTDRWTFVAAYTTGADTGFENTYDDHGFLGQIMCQVTRDFNISYSFHYANYGSEISYRKNPEYGRWYGNNETFIHTLYFDYDISSKWSYGFQWNLADAKDKGTDKHRVYYGIANYLTYKINKKLSLGLRAEWVKDDYEEDYGGGWVGLYAGEAQEYTLGLNWQPWSNISIRPEIRYDYCQEPTFDDGRRRDQVSGGVCGVVSF